MAAYFPNPERKLERALDNKTRRVILDLLIGERGLTVAAIAEKIEAALPNATYHVDVLLSCGAVETWVDEKRPEERLVRLPETPEKRKKEWLDVSGSMRDDISADQLKSLIEVASHLRPRPAPGT